MKGSFIFKNYVYPWLSVHYMPSGFFFWENTNTTTIAFVIAWIII